jgi:hypothetical protein
MLEFHGKKFPLADVRLLIPPTSDELVNLEFFFDGEVQDLEQQESEFIMLAISRITELYATSLREQVSEMVKNKNAHEIKNLTTNIKPFTPNTIRDAGCMLRFVAVRLSLEPRIAAFVGREVFPEEFGGQIDPNDDEGKLPAWFSLVVMACIVAFASVVFAWSRIISKALEQHSSR